MVRKLSKGEVRNGIKEFFQDVGNKEPTEVRKIRRLAMKHNIRLGKEKKKFCNKCLSPYKNPKTRIRKNFKVVTCGTCENVRKWKL